MVMSPVIPVRKCGALPSGTRSAAAGQCPGFDARRAVPIRLDPSRKSGCPGARPPVQEADLGEVRSSLVKPERNLPARSLSAATGGTGRQRWMGCLFRPGPVRQRLAILRRARMPVVKSQVDHGGPFGAAARTRSLADKESDPRRDELNQALDPQASPRQPGTHTTRKAEASQEGARSSHVPTSPTRARSRLGRRHLRYTLDAKAAPNLFVFRPRLSTARAMSSVASAELSAWARGTSSSHSCAASRASSRTRLSPDRRT